MADLSLVIDPGGIAGIRPGINLLIEPSGNHPLESIEDGVNPERLANGNLSLGGFEERLEFECEAYLELGDYYKLKGLLNYMENARATGGPWEIVIYNLCDPFVEESASRSRFIVPSTSVISQELIAANPDIYRWVYWIAVQGGLSMDSVRVGDFYKVNLSFIEGTKLTSDMEI